jgi:hypothetical protein
MPWLIKSRGRALQLRDGGGHLLEVGAEWVPFEHLPSNTDPHSDNDVECMEVDSLEGRKPGRVIAAAVAPSSPPAPGPSAAADRRAAKGRKATLAATVKKKSSDKEESI